ncbi:sensor histidine kinase [Nonomuraea mangrovi]|uniref:histidine kinase n=1 Tax=Nonomuraea mangrovi TaxID=2316207 RepID=A0ABW4TFH0_9ACTN
MTIRVRLTLLYGTLFAVAGALLLVLTYLLLATQLTWIAPPPEIFDEPPLDPLLQREADLRQFVMAGAAGLGVMTVVSVGLGWVMAGRALRPLRTMTAAARDISARNLHQRLAMTGPGDEIKNLADTFDGLLARVESAFEAQRRFVANASHELRTPLTFERTLLEVALADPAATADGLRRVCGRALEVNGHQERLIEALLTLARSQRGLDHREPLDLASITGDLLSDVSDRVEAELHPASATGDPRLVERLVANLVDNARRHNTKDGWVRVWTGVHEGRPSLRVSNPGPRIPLALMGELFQPFRRMGSARTGEGLGLGLSIVAAIAAAHDARVDARPIPDGGLEVLVAF